MALPSSPVDICNMALDLLGQPPISSISPPSSTTEQVVARHYDSARQTVLRKYPCNFAKRRGVCNRTGDVLFDFSDAYQLPNDFVRFLSVEGDGEIHQSTDYDIEGRQVLLNNAGAASVNIRYTADITDVTTWDALFRRMVVLTLAGDLAYAITKKKSDIERIDALIAREMPDAMSVDGQEVPPRRIQRSKQIIARRMGVGWVAGRYTVIQ